MTETTPPPVGPWQTVSGVIAERLPQLRGEHDHLRRQEDVAFRMATVVGEPWTRATVAAVETGKREVGFDEVLALSMACGIPPYEWFAGEGRVLITPGTTVTRRVVRRMLGSGESVDEAEVDLFGQRFGRENEDLIHATLIREVLRSVWPNDDLPQIKDPGAAALDSNKVAEQKAAARLGLKPLALSALAHALWGQGLTDEREARVADQSRDAGSNRTLQALRGHVTRSLIKELQAKLGEAER